MHGFVKKEMIGGEWWQRRIFVGGTCKMRCPCVCNVDFELIRRGSG